MNSETAHARLASTPIHLLPAFLVGPLGPLALDPRKAGARATPLPAVLASRASLKHPGLAHRTVSRQINDMR
jgi:hypothetical protein